MTLYVVALALGVPVHAWLLLRSCRRAEERRQARRIAEAFQRFGVRVGGLHATFRAVGRAAERAARDIDAAYPSRC